MAFSDLQSIFMTAMHLFYSTGFAYRFLALHSNQTQHLEKLSGLWKEILDEIQTLLETTSAP